ncbi:MAG: trigger factor [Solirubrobacteraceae bacterium]|jgi:trigger factor|nr:trigger factor [Solirubrobacteraceae bacterium]
MVRLAMPETAVKTSVTELPESRVRVEAEVVAAEVERSLTQAARAIGRDLRVPGFRQGKIPPPVVIRRLGRETLLDETVKEKIASWYTTAIGEAGIAPIGDPDISLGELPGAGESLHFTIEIGVRPKATLGDWRGLEVPRRAAVVDEEELAAQLEQMRERNARLENQPGREAELGDFVIIDYDGIMDGEALGSGTARGQTLELGSGRLIAGFESGLVGAVAGEERVLELTFPENYGKTELAGKPIEFRVTVKDVKAKVLPELDDEFASAAAGFETLEELREDVRVQLLSADERQAEREYREAVLDAAVERSEVEVPQALIEARSKEAWEHALRSLAEKGISKDAYLRLDQRPEEEIIAAGYPDAAQALRREAVVVALVEAEAIEATEEELLEVISEQVEPDQSGKVPDTRKVLAALRKNGRISELAENITARKAVDLIVSHATAVPAPPPPPAANPAPDGPQALEADAAPADQPA